MTTNGLLMSSRGNQSFEEFVPSQFLETAFPFQGTSGLAKGMEYELRPDHTRTPMSPAFSPFFLSCDDLLIILDYPYTVYGTQETRARTYVRQEDRRATRGRDHTQNQVCAPIRSGQGGSKDPMCAP